MTTSRAHSVAAALGALALASACISFTGTASQASVSPSTAVGDRIERTAPTSHAPHARAVARAERSAYGWPVKPFARQHPVRGFFGDPRVANHGRSRQFHFGIDISAPNGTPVYATLTGTIYIHALHRTTIAIVGSDGVEFSYWHVVPAVRSGQRAVAYRTVIGHIEEPYGHVHFSESRNRRYLNPLRPGALGPFADHTRPEVVGLRAEGGDLVVRVADETPLAVPRPWHDLPVMPALVRWRLLDANGRPASPWKTVVDFRHTIPAASEFDRTWAPGATQNHVRAPGRYRLFISREHDERALRGRAVEIAVSDSRGNATVARFATAGLLGRA
jgi:hypothetical protein